MPSQTSAEIQKKLELRSQALTANREELPQMEIPIAKLDELLGQVRGLTAEQASLTASKQEVSKRLAELLREALFLITCLDAGIRQHYGNRSEKLVEFGLQPFRSQPRIRLVGPDGKPVKRSAAAKRETPDQPGNE